MTRLALALIASPALTGPAFAEMPDRVISGEMDGAHKLAGQPLAAGGKSTQPICTNAPLSVTESPRAEGRAFNMGVLFPVSTHNHAFCDWLAAGGIEPGYSSDGETKGRIGTDAAVIANSMTGGFEDEKGDIRPAPDFSIFFREIATSSIYSHAIWHLIHRASSDCWVRVMVSPPMIGIIGFLEEYEHGHKKEAA